MTLVHPNFKTDIFAIILNVSTEFTYEGVHPANHAAVSGSHAARQ